MGHFTKENKSLRLLPHVFDILHRELIAAFVKHYAVNIESYPNFQLYGFDHYDDTKPNLAGYVYDCTKVRVNGKYLYNKVRGFRNGWPEIKLSRQYAYVYFFVLGNKNVFDFINSSFFDEDVRSRQLRLNDLPYSGKQENDYYVGYYFGEDNEIIKTRLTIDKNYNKVEWVLVYWELPERPSSYTYRGVVRENKMNLSFYFKAEHSTVERDAFISIFCGNRNVESTPFLLGTYSGFDKSSCPVAGEIIFERVASEHDQKNLVHSRDVDFAIQNFLIYKRIVSRVMIPRQKFDLNKDGNYVNRLSMYAGTYTGTSISMGKPDCEELTLTIIPKTNQAKLTFGDGQMYTGYIRLIRRGVVLLGCFGSDPLICEVALMLNTTFYKNYCMLGTYSYINHRNHPSVGEVCFVKDDHSEDFLAYMTKYISNGMHCNNIEELDGALINYFLSKNNDENFLPDKTMLEGKFSTSKNDFLTIFGGTYEVYHWSEEGAHILKNLMLITDKGTVYIKSSTWFGIGEATVFADGVLSISMNWCAGKRSHQRFLLHKTRDDGQSMWGMSSTVSGHYTFMAQKVFFIKINRAFKNQQCSQYDPNSDHVCSLSASYPEFSKLLKDQSFISSMDSYSEYQ